LRNLRAALEVGVVLVLLVLLVLLLALLVLPVVLRTREGLRLSEGGMVVLEE